MNNKQIDVIGLGASTIDVLTLVEHFPKGREVQQALSTVIQGGGPVATALVAVSRLGGRTAMIDSIGDDWVGDLVLKDFQREGVGTETIEIHRDRPPPFPTSSSQPRMGRGRSCSSRAQLPNLYYPNHKEQPSSPPESCT